MKGQKHMKKQATIKLTLELDNIYQVMALAHVLDKLGDSDCSNETQVKTLNALKDLVNSLRD